MPNLRHLFVFSVVDTDGAYPFFKAYGKQLESLEFSVPDLEVNLLLNMCPNLQDLVISLYSFMIHAPTSFYFCHDNVRRIGIRDMPPQAFKFEESRSIMDEVVSNLTDINFPKLALVRFLGLSPLKLKALKLDVEFVRYLYQAWILPLRDIHVLVEDGRGVKFSY